MGIHLRAEAEEFRAWRMLYESDLKLSRIFLHYVGNRREIYKRI